MTITQTRSNRRVLRPFAIAALIVVTMAGCHYTRTATGAVGQREFGSLGLCNPDKGSSQYDWVPAPGTVKLRLKLSSSSSTYPISATAFLPIIDAASWGTVWDGSQSTGSKEIWWSGEFVLVFGSDDPSWESRTFTYQLTPLDSAGNETSFIDCPPKLD